MPMEWRLLKLPAVTAAATGYLGQVTSNPLFVILLILVGICIGLFFGFLYSYAKSRFSRTEADRKLKRIVANFEQEKDASESILRELQVGILAYGGDGKLVTGNPSAIAILGTDATPPTLQAFLTQYGNDNGIQAALVLQTPNITGVVCIHDRTVRLRLTQTQLAPFHKPGWIIIIQDITEQEREEKQRKEFVANVSHELKTPLTTISAYSETLLDWGLEGKSMPDIRSDIMRIHDDASRMDTLVQNLLLLSSIDSRGIRPKMAQYDIVNVMRQVVSRMQVQAVEKEIQLESSVLSIIPPVYGDVSAIDRILTNLVSNGVKYTDYHGYVSVSVQLTNDYVSLKVKDNGMGVAKDNLQRLFDRFYRVDATGSRKYGGTGLGLSIAKELTEIQGGTISVSSVLGKGTEFVVTIPKAEKTYREMLTAIFDGSPRREILYENAQVYLQSAVEEIDIPVQELSELSELQIEELMSYLLSMPDSSELEYFVVSPSELLPARYEAAKRANSREKSAVNRSREHTPSENKLPHTEGLSPAIKGSHNTNSGRELLPSVPSSNSHQVSQSAVRRAAIELSGETAQHLHEMNSQRSNGEKTIQRNSTTPVRTPVSSPVVPQMPSNSPAKSHPDRDGNFRTAQGVKAKLPKAAIENKIITIDQLHNDNLKGEHHA